MEKQVQIGQLVASKYRIEQILGRGGMGIVMAALHEQLNQRVALKFLTDDAYQQPEAVARFVREARAAVQIQSEHVARVMDVGTLESGAPYMVMEYLRGRDLKDVSLRRGPLPVVEAVDYVLQACDAVAEAHSLGIVHRDLKPSNLFLTERPDGTPLVKVLDFGISKALHKGENSQLQMTASAAIMGSPQYMSPEQIRSSKNVDARADVWALGTILHELLTGSPAYVADTVPGLLAMIVADPPPPLSASRPDAPAELEAAVLRCLEKDRDRRFASVAELARAIERFASNETRPLVKRIARVLGDAPPPSTFPLPASSLGSTVRDPGSNSQTNGTWARTGRVNGGGGGHRIGVWVAVGVGVMGLSFGGWALLRPAPSADGSRSVATAGTGASNDSSTRAPIPTEKPASPTQTPPEPVKPSVGVVRPVESPPDPAGSDQPPAIEQDADSAASDAKGDLFVKEAKSRADVGAATKSKKPAAARPERPRPPTSRPKSPATSTARTEPAAPAPASSSKKSDGFDLFNDTK